MHLSRRALWPSLASAPFSVFAAQTHAPKVTISGLEIFRVKVNRRGAWIIARLQTSAGVTGIGDASQSANDELMVRYMRQFFEAMKARSIYDVEYLRSIGMPEAVRNHLPAAVAMSAIEQCLWDIRGKVF